MKNNKGITLIELIVSFAILGILILMLVGFISSGSNTYRSVSADVNLQIELQIAMNHIKEYLIDCNGGICYDGKTLYILNVEEEDSFTEHRFLWNENTIDYEKYTFSVEQFTPQYQEGGLLTDRVEGFYVTMEKPENEKDLFWPTTSVSVEINMSRLGKVQTGLETIALRNSVYTALSRDVMVEGVYEHFLSK